jgi:flavin reductase (DIM6/NTAB) family NADH-FMN oxidoreductase RutF
MRQAVELKKAYRLLNHGPTVLVTSAAGERRNVMAAAWSMPLDFDPPKVTVVIDKSTYTRELVEASGEFVLNIPARGLAKATVGVGDMCGRDVDKFAHFGLKTMAAEKVAAPLLDGCVGWLECRVIPEPHVQQTYDLFIAEVIAAWADPLDFSEGHWHFAASRERSIHYIAGGAFFETGAAFQVD